MVELSVVIVNYHSAGQTLAALRSVRDETRRHRYELIVVDNDEDGAGGDCIEREADDVTVLRSGGNPGFGVACNAGMAVAHGRWILLLNPDTRILDGAIDRCLDYLARLNDPRVAMLGCEHIEADGSLQISSFPEALWPSVASSLANNAVLRPLVRWRRPDLLDAKTREWQRARQGVSHDADAIQGSFLMVRNDLLAETGGFDPDFFLYFEELDWCRRVRAAGYRIVFCKDARLVHATRRRHDDPATERQAYLSEALFVLKRHGRWACALHVLLRHLNVVVGLATYPFLDRDQRMTLRRHARLLGFGHPDWVRPLIQYGPRFGSGRRPLRVRGGATGSQS